MENSWLKKSMFSWLWPWDPDHSSHTLPCLGCDAMLTPHPFREQRSGRSLTLFIVIQSYSFSVYLRSHLPTPITISLFHYRRHTKTHPLPCQTLLHFPSLRRTDFVSERKNNTLLTPTTDWQCYKVKRFEREVKKTNLPPRVSCSKEHSCPFDQVTKASYKFIQLTYESLNK